MNFWIIADSHLGHERTQEMCDRPAGFEELILQNLQPVTQPDDVVIHLGDVSFYDHELWHGRFTSICDCKKWLFRGNHDKKSVSWYLSHGWDVVAEEMSLNIYGKRIVLSHRPVTSRNDFDLNIHGHLHNTGHRPDVAGSGRHCLVYLEHEYRPLSLRSVVERTARHSVRYS